MMVDCCWSQLKRSTYSMNTVCWSGEFFQLFQFHLNQNLGLKALYTLVLWDSWDASATTASPISVHMFWALNA